MRVQTQDYKYAFCTAPTQHWRGGMNRAMDIIESHITEKGDDYFVVDDKAWSDAMQILVRLPYNGRHVWKERADLFRRLNKATQPQQGEANATDKP